MSALLVQAPPGAVPGFSPLRFASTVRADGASVQWLLKRNCSITPRQLLGFYLSLAFVSLGIATVLGFHGALLVLPFAGLELLGVGACLLAYARHATDRERLLLRAGRLTVECTLGTRTERVEFTPAWVCVEPRHGDHSLIELSGEGRRIAVGRFVRPELRRALADELRFALRRCRAWSPSAAGASSAADADRAADRHPFDL